MEQICDQCFILQTFSVLFFTKKTVCTNTRSPVIIIFTVESWFQSWHQDICVWCGPWKETEGATKTNFWKNSRTGIVTNKLYSKVSFKQCTYKVSNKFISVLYYIFPKPKCYIDILVCLDSYWQSSGYWDLMKLLFDSCLVLAVCSTGTVVWSNCLKLVTLNEVNSLRLAWCFHVIFCHTRNFTKKVTSGVLITTAQSLFRIRCKFKGRLLLM